MSDALPAERRGMWIILLLVLPVTMLSTVSITLLTHEMTGNTNVLWDIASNVAFVLWMAASLWRGDRGAKWILMIILGLELAGSVLILFKPPQVDSIWRIWTIMACSILAFMLLRRPDVDSFINRRQQSRA